MKWFAQYLEDLRWSRNALRARRVRRSLSDRQRKAFDEALRPGVDAHWPLSRVSYPDAFYTIGIDDVVRASIIGWTTSNTPAQRGFASAHRGSIATTPNPDQGD